MSSRSNAGSRATPSKPWRSAATCAAGVRAVPLAKDKCCWAEFRRCTNGPALRLSAPPGTGRRQESAVGKQVTSARQRGENPVGSFGHAYFGQHVNVVPQSRIDGDQAIVFRKRLGEIMPSFLVQRVD